MMRTVDRSSGIRRAGWFFLLTFLWSWAFWGMLILTGAEWNRFPAVLLYALGGVGPTVVAAGLVGMGHGVDGPRPFWRRATNLRQIPPAWYLVILGIALVPNLLARLLPASEEGERSVALVAILLVALLAGVAEEPGWRGYALDHLTGAMSARAAGLVIGLAWTLWHLPFYFIEGSIQQEAGLWSPEFWADMSARLPLALLFAWVVVNTGGSILAAILLHAADNCASVLLGPDSDTQLFVRLAIVTALAVLVAVRWGPALGQSRLLQPGRRAPAMSPSQEPPAGNDHAPS